MKIAFATSDCLAVDEQFRRATHLVVYEITESGHALDRICAFPQDRAVKTEERIRAITGASIVYVTAIGPSSAARLAARGIRPAPVPAGTPIAKVLAGLATRGGASAAAGA
jgi:nitrogen fixation protein NifX